MDTFLAIVSRPGGGHGDGPHRWPQRNHGAMFVTPAHAARNPPRQRWGACARSWPGCREGAVPSPERRRTSGIGGRFANSAYQFTLQSDSLDELRLWEPRASAMPHEPVG